MLKLMLWLMLPGLKLEDLKLFKQKSNLLKDFNNKVYLKNLPSLSGYSSLI